MPSMPTKTELKKNLKALKGRLERRPMDLDARMRMARTHRLLGEKKQAVAHYRSVARYLSLAGQPLQAIAVLKELLQVDPRHEETLLFLAKLYARTRVSEGHARGRVAVPIADPPTGPIALPEGLPMSATGVWNAIRPMATDVFTVVHEAEDVGAEIGDGGAVSVAAELRELEDTLDLDEDDIVAEAPAEEDAGGLYLDEATTVARPSAGNDGAPTTSDDPFGTFDVDADEYEILGMLSTEDILLPQVPLFSSLPPEAFVDLGHAMVFHRANEGTVLFEEGDPGDSFIVFSRGRAKASRVGDNGEEVELMQLGEGDFAGLFALLSAQQRNARLTALTYVEYFEIDRLAVDELIDKHPQVKVALAHFFRERLLLNLLAQLPCFSTLSATERQNLVHRFKNKAHEADDELFYQGFEHDGLWVVLEGKVRVGREGQPAEVTLVPGDYVGSFAGSDEGETEMGAVAAEKAVVALLSHKAFGDVLKVHPDLAGVRKGIEDAGLMISGHVFAGNGRLPGRLVNLKPVFR